MCLVDCPMRLAGSTRFVALLTCFSINHLNSFTPYMNLELHTSTNSECGVDLHIQTCSWQTMQSVLLKQGNCFYTHFFDGILVIL